MRLNLARALMCRSDLLLLDEPTNHLDLDTIIWLEAWLTSYQGTLLLISHDRDFLNNICTHIAYLEHQNIQVYTGNYSAFERLRAERLAAQQSQFVKQQRNIAHIESYIARFRAQATKAKQAYRKLISQYHPDKLIGQGVPEDMIQKAFPDCAVTLEVRDMVAATYIL